MPESGEVGMPPGQTAGVAGNTAAPGGSGVDERVPPAVRKLLELVPALQREPHLVTVHFALVFPMAVPLFNILYLLRPGRRSLEKSAFYMLVLGATSAPVAISTGLFTWWLNFKARATRPVKVKIAVSLALEADLLLLLAWRLADGEIMSSSSRSRVAYVTLSLAMPALTLILGRVGGRLSGHR